MKKLIGIIALAGILSTGLNARDSFDESASQAAQVNACVQAVSSIEKMAGASSTYNYTDRTGRQINVNFGTLCTALPEFNKYIEREFDGQFYITRVKALANLLLMRSPISDKELLAYADKGASSKEIKKNGVGYDKNFAYMINWYLHKYPMINREDQDKNILTPKYTHNYAAEVPYLTRCYTGMECSSDKEYGLGNKTFQSLLLALTQRDYNQAINILLNYNTYLIDHNKRDNQVAKYIAITIGG